MNAAELTEHRQAITCGMNMAARFFDKRGSVPRVEVSRKDLAALLAIAFEFGRETGAKKAG